MKQLIKHTAGPWQLCSHLKNLDKCPCGYRGGIYGGDGKGMICEMGSTSIVGEEGLEMPRYGRYQEFANANLIAAAPDLYEALETWLQAAQSADETGYVDGVGFLDIKQFHTMAEKALSKAKGGA